MTNPKVSIIVPVYNIEEYLPACLDSMLDQDFEDYEVLLINDGSTDSSGEICDTYALKDNRIQVYHQKNAGVSAARNLGIEKSNGHWICFVDGDDMLCPNSLTPILKETEKHNSEMLIARSFKNINEQIANENYKFDQSFLNKTFDGYTLITKKAYKRGSVCGCLFNRQFLKKHILSFPVGLKNAEDSLFMSLVYLYAKRISFIDQTFYLVNEREGSASRSWTSERVFKMIDNIKFVNQYLNKNSNLTKEQHAILEYTKYTIVSAIFNNFYECFSVKTYSKLITIIKKELSGNLNTRDIKISKFKIKLLNFSLPIFAFTVLVNQRLRDSL